MTNEQQRSPIFCLDNLKKHLYNTIWGIKQLLTITGAVDGSTQSACWVVMPWDPNGRVHNSVEGSFSPGKIILLLNRTMHSSRVNVTSHPVSVSTQIPKTDAMDKSGMMCPVNTNGRLSIRMSHICVDMTWRLPARETRRGHVVGRLFNTRVTSIKKIGWHRSLLWHYQWWGGKLPLPFQNAQCVW